MNKLKAFIAVVLTFVTLTHSKPSQAAVGALVSTPVLIAGLVIGGAGLIGTAVSVSKCGDGGGEGQGLCKAFIVLIGAPIILIGLVLLDGEQEVGFRELSGIEATALDISRAELALYNSEIDQANMLIAEVQTELSKIAKPTAQDSQNAWSDVKELVSPATYGVMQKIASQK